MARWLIGVLVLALSASPARAACWASAWQDALDALAAVRNSRPTSPSSASERALRETCGADEACLPGQPPKQVSPIADFSDGMVLCVVLAPAIAILMVPLGLVMWLMWYLRRRREAGEARRPESVSLLVVERIARAMQRRGGVLAAIGIAGVPVLVAAQSPTAIASTIVACVGIRGFCVARDMLRVVEAPSAAVERLGTTMILRHGDDEMHVEVSSAALARASRHAVPTSVAKRA